MLTNSDLKQILEALAKYGKKDSQLEAIQELPEEDNSTYLSIVYGTKNYRINLNKFKEALFESLIEGALPNIIDDEPVEDSIKLVRSGGVYDAINNPKVIHESQLDDDSVSTRTIIDSSVTYDKLDKGLHKQIVKYTSNISVSPSSLRINGENLSTTLNKTDKLSSFGDAGESATNPDSSTTTSPDGVIDGNTWSFVFPQTVGTYTVTYKATKNGTERVSTANVSIYLRKYFGFSESVPSNLEELEALSEKADSPSVNWEDYINAKGTGDKYIYFAVPYNMTIHNITQPDALYAPFAFTQLNDITITINRTNYTYKLYRSTDKVDSSVNKKLKIS